MKTVVIYKQDGTIQCYPNIPPRPLAEDETALLKLGVGRICDKANVPGPLVVNAPCGAPTGQVNSFAIPADDWEQLQAGIVGTLGFKPWTGAPLPEMDLGPCCESSPPTGWHGTRSGADGTPVLIRELVGRPVRCYRLGDPITKDFRPDRVNIVHLDSRVTDVWFG